jgi:trehalose-6-phosphate synthase
MRASAHQDHTLGLKLIDQQPIGHNVAFPLTFPFPEESMFLIFPRKRKILLQMPENLNQIGFIVFAGFRILLRSILN